MTTSKASTGSSTSIANSVVGTAQWAAKNKAVLTALGADMSALGSTLPAAVASHELSAVSPSCQKLAGDLTQAHSLPPIPNSADQQAWASLLTKLSSASQNCSDGIATNDTGKIHQAATDIEGSSGPLNSLSHTLGL